MAAPRIRITIGASVGADDEARDDGVAGATATIASLDGPAVLSFATENEATARGTLAGANPGTSWTFTIGPAGSSYLLRLTSPATGEWVERELLVPTDAGIVIPARRSSGDPYARLDNITTAGIRRSTNNRGGTPWATDQNLETALRQIPPKLGMSASNPTVDDDVTEGYRAGSLWVNTSTPALFYCSDPTEGAAQWQAGGSGDSAYAAKSGNYALQATDRTVGFDTTSARTATLALLANVPDGAIVRIADITGDAAQNPITVNPDGSDTFEAGLGVKYVTESYGVLSILKTASSWVEMR